MKIRQLITLLQSFENQEIEVVLTDDDFEGEGDYVTCTKLLAQEIDNSKSEGELKNSSS